jgi:hypothetical protein
MVMVWFARSKPGEKDLNLSGLFKRYRGPQQETDPEKRRQPEGAGGNQLTSPRLKQVTGT